MKGYMDYMDSVGVSPELHEKLTGLAAPAKKPAWRRYGAVAAALVLVLGAGALGVSRMVKWSAPAGNFRPDAETADAQPDIAPEDPVAAEPGMQTIGGYEVLEPEDGENSVVGYYMLPYIAYGEQTAGVAADYSLVPPDGGTRELTEEDVLSILGCEKAALTDHLGWGGCSLHGTVGFNADGTTACAYIYGDWDGLAFVAELCPDRLPPQCCIFIGQEVTTTDVWGVEVAGIKDVGMRGDAQRGIYLDVSRRVEFIAHNVGVRFTVYGTDDEQVSTFVSRFVRWAVLEGLDLSDLSPEGAEPIGSAPVDAGEPNWEDGEPVPTPDSVDPYEALDPSYGVGDDANPLTT